MTDERQWTDIRRRIRLAVTALALVLVAGSVGYYALGFSLIDAVYQTVTTVSTVGFREVHPFDTVGKTFTIVLILAGVGLPFTPSASSSRLSSRAISDVTSKGGK